MAVPRKHLNPERGDGGRSRHGNGSLLQVVALLVVFAPPVVFALVIGRADWFQLWIGEMVLAGAMLILVLASMDFP